MNDKKIEMLAQNMGQIEARMRVTEASIKEIVDKINEWAKSIDSIDQVAFICMYMLLDGVDTKSKITKAKVKSTHAAIADSFKRLEEYRNVIMEEAKKKEEKNGNKKDKTTN